MSPSRILAVVAVAALTGACAASGPALPPGPLTPTDRYPLQVVPSVERIALAQHPGGELSPAQQAAIADLAWRARHAGADVVTVETPGDAAPDTAWAVRAALEAHGVPAARVRVVSYAAHPGAPVLAGFVSAQAAIPDCSRTWNNLTSTASNASHASFGCATTANLAAQIADPRDIGGGRPLDPADAGRRSVVLGKYRQGEVTASESNDDSAGQVSEAVQ